METKDNVSMFASGISNTDINTSTDYACPENIWQKREGVQYNDFIHETYYSKTCEMERGYSILLPLNYSENRKYPVLYMLHGIFGDEYSFSSNENTGMRTIFANMASDKMTKEMIVVFPNTYATKDPDAKPGFSYEECLPYDNFVNELVCDLMPVIEQRYSVASGRENTIVGGFSMGGRESLYIALLKPELFGYAFAVSPAPGLIPSKDRFMEHKGSLKESEISFKAGVTKPQILIMCGSIDSVVGKFPETYHKLMTANNVEHTWYELLNADHDDQSIRSGTYNFLKNIYR